MHDKDATNAKLQELASASVAFVGNKKSKPQPVISSAEEDAIEAEYESLNDGTDELDEDTNDAIYEEREEGLQKGE